MNYEQKASGERAIADVNEYDGEYYTAELICIRCGFRYIGVWPVITPMATLHCDRCETVGSLIKTGEFLFDEEDECEDDEDEEDDE
jgi:hypothetical protein